MVLSILFYTAKTQQNDKDISVNYASIAPYAVQIYTAPKS